MSPNPDALERLRVELRPELIAVRGHINQALSALGAVRTDYARAQQELALVLAAVPHLLKVFDALSGEEHGEGAT